MADFNYFKAISIVVDFILILAILYWVRWMYRGFIEMNTYKEPKKREKNKYYLDKAKASKKPKNVY